MLSIHSSIQGMQKSVNSFNKSADRISKSGLETKIPADDKMIEEIEDKITLTNNNDIDITTEFIKMELAEVCYKANAKVVKTSDEMLGTSINIKA